jgi:hypothetical protein
VVLWFCGFLLFFNKGGAMPQKLPVQTESLELPRRRFMQDAATAAIATCLSPGLLFACQAKTESAATTSSDAMEQALEMMAGLAPLTNHGPMAAEALIALGRSERVVGWVEGYKKRFMSAYPETHQQITRENWREALGDGNRVADWTRFFNRELKEAAWPQVLEKWSTVLAPGLAAAAAHGLIRTGHAVRSLSVKETDLRRRELAEGLGYWAAYYQPLPEKENSKTERLKPAQAINRIPLLPAEKRPQGGSIMIGLRSLNDFPPFSNAANLVEPAGKADLFLSEMTETFATAYLKNVNRRNNIALIHTVTGTTALRSLLPYLPTATKQLILHYGWQMAAALYSVFGSGSNNSLSAAKEIKRDDLIDRAVATQDEHAIKFTEACLREYALNPKPIYLQAADEATERLDG